MSWQVVKRPAAEADITELATHIAMDSMATAERFLECAEAAFTQLAETPYIGRPWVHVLARLKGLRVSSIPGFRNHLVFYRPSKHTIDVVRVLHGARDLDSALSE
jgi:toxin ParE1/3/4